MGHALRRVAALDEVEQDAAIPLAGQIGIQVHGGGKALVDVKEITIRPTPMESSWRSRSAPRGRLWTTTAMEYPVDANESPEASKRLFATGGRDKVLVIDDPWAAKPSPPRVFAEKLAIPLGVQESHLFPHQFTRVPGGWILLDQGLFNTSLVKRPGGQPFADGAKEVPFTECKLARMRPDGAAFEALTGGPNNIWGLTISRQGETWLQEANDIGFPIATYEPGCQYPTRQSNRLKPYQPMMPAPMGPPQMGGSGLSGLALADDADGWPGPWGAGANATPAERIFYVANPITNSIQTIIATRAGGARRRAAADSGHRADTISLVGRSKNIPARPQRSSTHRPAGRLRSKTGCSPPWSSNRRPRFSRRARRRS